MSVTELAGDKTAKMTAIERVLASVSKEATKEVVSQQAINAAISAAVQQWLKIADEPTRVAFFAAIEAVVSESVARKIERHPLRPAAVTPLVETARAKTEAEKLAKKSNASRTKEEREMQQLAELKAKYEAKGRGSSKASPEAEA
ncbi:hypothetical protein [Paracoccus sp. T5]|uniref:hypothetical protein n=1 Tax=Paracoccus sp. T5 TaxID=3402161 RepID=UPI003AD98B5E